MNFKNDLEQHLFKTNSSSLTGTQRLVLFVMSTIADYNTGENMYASQSTIAERAGITPRGVRKVLVVLEDLGYIVRTGSHTVNGKTTIEYALRIPDTDANQAPVVDEPADPETVTEPVTEPATVADELDAQDRPIVNGVPLNADGTFAFTYGQPASHGHGQTPEEAMAMTESRKPTRTTMQWAS